MYILIVKVHCDKLLSTLSLPIFGPVNGGRFHVITWQISNTLDVTFCLEALYNALVCGKPEIFNTVQSS
jgi:hypothetical protein